MKQEIIQILDDIAKESIESFWESIGTDVYPTWISTAKERIQSLWDGWIPVTERLPEEWCYLAFSDGIMYVTATWNDSIFWNAWEIVSWVTHWMNLPNPPKQ